MPRIFIRCHKFTLCIEFCNGKDWKHPISHALLDVFAVDNDMIWMTRSIDSGRIRINIWRQCNWHTWLHSSGGDGIRDTDIYFSSPHRTFPFTRIIFLLAKHICQLPALSMRAWEKTNTIFWGSGLKMPTGSNWIFSPVNKCRNYSRDQRDSRFSRILENFFLFSLLVLDLELFQFHFQFSKKSEGIFFSLFTSRKKWKLSVFHSFFSRKKSEIRRGV